MIKDLAKLGPIVKSWPWFKVCCLAGFCLLARGIVNFNQFLILVLLTVVLDQPHLRRLRGRGPGRTNTTSRS